jgi:hypothetical protein
MHKLKVESDGFFHSDNGWRWNDRIETSLQIVFTYCLSCCSEKHAISFYYSQDAKKRFWILPNLLIRVSKSSLLVDDKVNCNLFSLLHLDFPIWVILLCFFTNYWKWDWGWNILYVVFFHSIWFNEFSFQLGIPNSAIF